MPDLNIFNLDFGNLAKLMNKGRVDKVYQKMWYVADRLSREEFNTFRIELLANANKFKSTTELLTTLTDFKKDRITFHMNEMKKLLEMSLKSQSKEK
jgi:hypothetical protein